MGLTGGATSAKALQASQPLSRERQIQHVVQLLQKKGEETAKDLQRRIRSGEGTWAKGVYFDVSVFADAINTWERQRRRAAPAVPTSVPSSWADFHSSLAGTKQESRPVLPSQRTMLHPTPSSTPATPQPTLLQQQRRQQLLQQPQQPVHIESQAPSQQHEQSSQELPGLMRAEVHETAPEHRDSAFPSAEKSPEVQRSGLLKRKRKLEYRCADETSCMELDKGPSIDSEDEGSCASQRLSRQLRLGMAPLRPRLEPEMKVQHEPKPAPSFDLQRLMEESRRKAFSSSAVPQPANGPGTTPKATPRSSVGSVGGLAAAMAEAAASRKGKAGRASTDASRPLATPCRSRPRGSPWQMPSPAGSPELKSYSSHAEPEPEQQGITPSRSSTSGPSSEIPRSPPGAPLDPEAAGQGAADSIPRISVKDLKARLAVSGLDFSCCVEKAELQAIWQQYQVFQAMPPDKLQELCAAAGGPKLDSQEECARFLVAPKPSSSSSASPPLAVPRPAVATVGPVCEVSKAPAASHNAEAVQREREANDEVFRILRLRRDSFHSSALWGFTVLALPAGSHRDSSTVQRSYRTLMRRLHPDKVAQTQKVVKAVEIIREAKDACERSLLRMEPPGMPRGLRSEPIDTTTVGRRRFQLRWASPAIVPSAPVRRYIVAAFDPAYGKPLTITVLEPDYDQELGRFVSIEEMGSYVLAEEELQKMPSLWQQKRAKVQVAAANEAGQSPWATLEVPLSSAQFLTASTTASNCSSGSPCSPGFYSCSDSSPKAAADEKWSFEMELRRRCGQELRIWLRTQLKARLMSWLRSMNTETTGTKEELVQKIMLIVEGGDA